MAGSSELKVGEKVYECVKPWWDDKYHFISGEVVEVVPRDIGKRGSKLSQKYKFLEKDYTCNVHKINKHAKQDFGYRNPVLAVDVAFEYWIGPEMMFACRKLNLLPPELEKMTWTEARKKRDPARYKEWQSLCKCMGIARHLVLEDMYETICNRNDENEHQNKKR